MDSIFIVFGKKLDLQLENAQVLTTKIIPNRGDIISLKKGNFKITDKLIQYSQIEDYDRLNHPDRGEELIFLFVEKY